MKRVVFFLLILGSFSYGSTTVPVEFEWEEIPGSTRYEVQLLDKNRKIIKELSSETFVFKTDLEPGIYFIKGRVLDRRRAFSEWSSLSDFTISPPSPKLIEPLPPVIVPDSNTLKAELNLKWQPTPGTKEYLVILKDENGKTVQRITIEKNDLLISLKPGKYRYELISVAKNGLQSEPQVSESLFEVSKIELKKLKSLKKENNKISFEKSLDLPIKVSLYYKPYFGSWSLLSDEVVETENYELKNDLKPGEYRIISRHQSPDGELSEPLESAFVIKPENL